MKTVFFKLLVVLFVCGCDMKKQTEFGFEMDSLKNNIFAGQETKQYPAIFKLPYDGCTAAVVGLKPLTIITARHCKRFVTESASQIFESDVFDLTHDRIDKNGGDILIATFEKPILNIDAIEPKDLFVINSKNLSWSQTAKVCGFGLDGVKFGSSNTLSLSNPRCAEVSILVGNLNYTPQSQRLFYKRLSEKYLIPYDFEFDEPQFRKFASAVLPKLNAEEIGESWLYDSQYFIHSTEEDSKICFGQFRKSAHITIADFDPSFNQPVTNSGDSGGPVFVESGIEGDRPKLIAVNGMALPDRDGSKLIVLGISWRVDRPWVQDLLKNAKSKGADITID